ncbi:M23 family metallopeptidase [Jiella avicenniae]|uniref:M23 family metallopeptidase n=1 Tax=Jiella avicenniae TaxID=2907202 RepID=A0A9X1P6S1_9HYPH|nr:M23 family metallopeptidase [Jiella avicenniae]MCE7030794.1 M23 family metallopeptidase [Jiella avicenniae]
MQASKLTSTFGRRKEPHTVIIARGEHVRHFTVCRTRLLLGSALAAAIVTAAFAAPFGYVAAAPEDAGAPERQWQVRHEYEERIATLRAELDRATSRQFLAQKMVESKVDVLLEQQEELTARYERLRPLFDRAKSTGLLAAAVPIPTPKPEEDASDHLESEAASDSLSLAESDGTGDAEGPVEAPVEAMPDAPAANAFAPQENPAPVDWLARLRAEAEPVPAASTVAKSARLVRKPAEVISDDSLRRIGEAISVAELGQIRHLEALASTARGRAVRISSALAAAGIRVPGDDDEERAQGGPYEPVPAVDAFDQSVAELDEALDALQRVAAVTKSLPLERPMPARLISSTFGVRADPFLGRSAFHSGIDFAEPQGSAVRATAPGKVIKAGSYGGYGNMVEIDHGDGITTRYGHMSKIAVKVGATIARGETIGSVGSTGRSTGPHLHYEVRRNDKAVDPAKFFRLGDRIREFG